MQALAGKIAVITGGNSGIGKATAQLFAQQGAKVAITGRRQDVLDAAVAEIGLGVVGIQGDSADIAQHARLVREVRQRFGGLDIFVANAGVIKFRLETRGRPTAPRWVTPRFIPPALQAGGPEVFAG